MATIRNLVIRIGASTKGIDGALDKTTRGLLKTAAAAKLMERSARSAARGLDNVGDQAVQLAGQLRIANAAMSNSFTKSTKVVTKLGLAMAGVSVVAAGIGAGAAAGAAATAAAFLGLGVVLAAQNEKVQKDWKKTFATIAKDAKKLAQPFVGPLRQVSGIFLDTWKDIRGGLALVFKTLAPTVVPLARAIADAFKDVFAAIGSAAVVAKPMLLDLAVGIRQLGEDIKTFLTPIVGALRTSATGVFSQLLGGLGQILVALGPVVAQFIAFGAATIGPVLYGLSQVLVELEPVITALLHGLLPVVGEIVPALGGLANAFGTALTPILKTLGPVIGEVIAVMAGPLAQVIKILGAGLLSALQALAPHLPALASGFGELLVAFAPLITPFVELIAPAANLASALGAALLPVIHALVAAAGPFVEVIGKVLSAIEPLLVPVGQLIASLITGLLPVFGQLLTALIPLLPTLVSLAVTLATALVPVVKALVPPIAQVARVFGAALLKAVQALAPHLPALATSLAQLLVALIPLIPPTVELVVALAPLIPVVVDVIKLLTQLVNAVMPALLLILKRTEDQIKMAVGIIKWGFGIFYGVAKWTIEKVAGFFRWLYNLLVGHSIIPDLVNGMISWFGRIPRGIMNALGNLGGLLYNAGRNIIYGLINGIWSVARRLWDTMAKIVKGIRAYWPFSPAKVGPLSGSGAPNIAGMNIGRMFAAGIRASQGLVNTAAAGLAGAAMPAMAGPTLATPDGAMVVGGGGGGIDARAIADAVVEGLRRGGIVLEIDGERVAAVVSRRQGRQADYRRRTG